MDNCSDVIHILFLFYFLKKNPHPRICFLSILEREEGGRGREREKEREKERKEGRKGKRKEKIRKENRREKHQSLPPVRTWTED